MPVGSRITLYVAPDGNDAWSGKLERPNAERTRRAAGHAGRRQRRRAAAEGPGTAEASRSWCAWPAGRIRSRRRWSSSRKTAARPRPRSSIRRPTERGPCLPAGGRFTASPRPRAAGGRSICPRSQAGKWYFEDLYVNGRRAIRARSPNEFYYYIRGKAGPAVDPATGKTEPMPNRAFVADPKDIAPLAALPKEQLNDAMVVAYFSWENSRLARGLGRSARPARSC